MPGEFIPDPEWVMLGISQPEGVCVFASRELSMAELRHALIHNAGVMFDGATGRNEFSKAWELSVTMKDVYWATGTDYGDAIRRLFDEWSPDAGPMDRPIADPIRTEIMPARPAITREEGTGWAKQPKRLLPPRSS